MWGWDGDSWYSIWHLSVKLARLTRLTCIEVMANLSSTANDLKIFGKQDIH
jgi:hypothetical protein